MKLIGLTCGRPMGNSEVLMKEALMGAEEKGAEVEMIRMLDLDIRNCIRCKRCLWNEEQNPEKCIFKDDAPFLFNKIMDADGFILSVPLYSWSPPGQLFVIRDRILGPRVDLAFAIEAKKGTGHVPGRRFDERLFKPKVAAFIAQGGAHTTAQFALAPLYTLTFSMQAAVVDQILIYDLTSTPGAVVLVDKAIKRAHKLGQNVADALGKNYDDVKYKGDDPGVCPSCHGNLMVMGNTTDVECAVCNMYGKIQVDGNKLKVVFPEKELAKSRLSIEGKRLHGVEIMEVVQTLKSRFGEIPEKVEKYKAYSACLVKPPRKKKSADTDK